MNERIAKYVDNLFAIYKETEQLIELKEEIKANLFERINDSMANGVSEEEAFQKASKELGDLSELAEEISNKTKYEFLTNALQKNKKNVFGIGFAIATGIVLIGFISCFITYIRTDELFIALSTLFPFATVSIALFVFLGCSTETNHQYAMKPLRATLYTIASLLLTAGLFIALIIYTQQVPSISDFFTFQKEALFLSVTTFIPFIITAVCLYVFLIVTEKDRQKPNVWSNYYNSNGADEEAIKNTVVYGNMIGALWIFAIGLFLTISFLFGWKFSWLVFIFAIGFQVLLEEYFSKKTMKKQVL